MENRLALCELGLVPVIWPRKDVGNVIRLIQGRSVAEVRVDDNQRKTGLLGAVAAYRSMHVVDSSPESNEGQLSRGTKFKSEGRAEVKERFHEGAEQEVQVYKDIRPQKIKRELWIV